MKRVVTLLFLLCGTLWSAEVKATIAQGETKTYESLLATLRGNAKKDDDTALQQALLYKLINLTKNPPVEKIKIETPTDEKAYRDLIVQFGNWSLAKADAAKDIASLKERLDVVAEQLKNSESNASDLLTLQLQYAF